jgi:DNA adenine methylase
MSVPHAIPYQGSKRRLASTVLSFLPRDIHTLFEPFAGSAAVTVAAAHRHLARRYLINDSLVPLMGIWDGILTSPNDLADRYRTIWRQQLGRERAYYEAIREAFNSDGDPAKLLYLLARCVKNAVRFNRYGLFNQSADNRRKGTHPEKMASNIFGVHSLLSSRCEAIATDYSVVLAEAQPCDLVYMDPPYQGTSEGRDQRYFASLDLAKFVDQLERLNQRGVPYLVSFDGSCGTRSYGRELPSDLGLTKISIEVGRSSQATLNGRDEMTVESLYLSPGLGGHPSTMVRLYGQQKPAALGA